MSDGLQIALVGLAGTALGAVAAVVVAAIQARSRAVPQVQNPTVVLGASVDIRELRILRALYGEPKGRLLEGYKDPYYSPSLDAVVKKGWVKKVEGKYYMTAAGADTCRAYFKELEKWKPGDQILG